MTQEEKAEGKEAKKKADPEIIKEVLNNPDIKEEVERQVDKASEEKAKKMFLRKKIEDANAEKLMQELESYSQLEKDDFKSIISQREKLLSDASKVSINDLESFSNRIDSARRVEKTFRMLSERDQRRVEEDKPNISTSHNSLPETLDEIESNPDAYKKYALHDNFYLTHDPHKEFKDHEKNNLCSIYDDSCKEASDTWYKEFALSKNKNKKHIKNITIL